MGYLLQGCVGAHRPKKTEKRERSVPLGHPDMGKGLGEHGTGDKGRVRNPSS